MKEQLQIALNSMHNRCAGLKEQNAIRLQDIQTATERAEEEAQQIQDMTLAIEHLEAHIKTIQ